MHYGIYFLPIAVAFDAHAVDRLQHPTDFDTYVLPMPSLLPSDLDWEDILFEDEAERLHGGPTGFLSSAASIEDQWEARRWRWWWFRLSLLLWFWFHHNWRRHWQRLHWLYFLLCYERLVGSIFFWFWLKPKQEQDEATAKEHPNEHKQPWKSCTFQREFDFVFRTARRI